MNRKKNEVIVCGYIRGIQSLLVKNTIIPSDIIIVCYNFYLMNKNVFATCHKNNEFILFDITSNIIQNIAPRIGLNGDSPNALTYIPLISNLFSHQILSSNEIYDGIICQIRHEDDCHYYHYLFIYQLCHKKDLIYYETFRSISSCKQIHKYIYCGAKRGIMVIYNDDEDDNHSFMCLDEDKFLHINDIADVQNNRRHRRWSSYTVYEPKQMIYMNNTDKIWWIEGPSVLFDDDTDKKYGIYDLNTGKFTTFGTLNDCGYISCLCYNDENNAIYLLSETKNVIKYDINKKEWSNIGGKYDDILILFLCDNFLCSANIQKNKNWKCVNCGANNDKTYVICGDCFAENTLLSFKYFDTINGSEWEQYQTEIGDNICHTISVTRSVFFC